MGKTKKTNKTAKAVPAAHMVRNQRDTVFRKLFGNKEELLSLYNAVNGTRYDDPEDLEINTLDNAIYMAMKNDISCVVDMRLNLYEHQSTVNPNMPLRDLFYIAKVLEKMTLKKDLYARNRIALPAPKFVVFYNGEEEQPEQKIMKLSDSYPIREEVSLELIVIQLNINDGYNTELKENCRTLQEYIRYVEKIRRFQKTMPLAEAVNKAVVECITEGILSDFLNQNRAEVMQMSIFEYDEELHMATVREEGIAQGRKEGITEGIAQGRKDADIKLIHNMYRCNFTLEQIALATQKSIDEINTILSLISV